MADWAHWDFAEEFSGFEAAALILGISLCESVADERRVFVVARRLAQSYGVAINRLRGQHLDTQSRRDVELKSVAMEQAILKKETLSPWLTGRSSALFDNQNFSRDAIARWLEEVGQPSVYPFDRGQPRSPRRWPWGEHHTEALGHLDAAAKRFWVNVDPTDNTTAPTNKEVSEWLQSDRGVSRSMADAMASILRPDDLPTGPRR